MLNALLGLVAAARRGAVALGGRVLDLVFFTFLVLDYLFGRATHAAARVGVDLRLFRRGSLGERVVGNDLVVVVNV